MIILISCAVSAMTVLHDAIRGAANCNSARAPRNQRDASNRLGVIFQNYTIARRGRTPWAFRHENTGAKVRGRSGCDIRSRTSVSKNYWRSRKAPSISRLDDFRGLRARWIRPAPVTLAILI